MADEESKKVGVEALQAVSGANREAKAYAYLYAAFKRTEVSKNPIRDALDCFIPFVTPYLNSIQGKQVTLDGIQEYLRDTYGFEIPLYAVEQMLPELDGSGLVSFERSLKIYKAIGGNQKEYQVSRDEIETDFNAIEENLSSHAKRLGFNDEPPSGNWGNALIGFLRASIEETPLKITKIKGVLLEPKKVEIAIVGGYLRRLHHERELEFNRIVNVFMGILVEEFITSVSEVSQPVVGKNVIAFIDTAILLRLLGCSGHLHRTATEELIRYLQDTGFQTYFLPGNETEVAGILDAVIFTKDSGRELEGETADAIASGEVSISDIRSLKGTFPEALAKKNVFASDNLSDIESSNARHQIDELGFSEFLKQESQKRGRLYGHQNRENDSGYLGTVMRVRAGTRSRDIFASKCIFVTSNKFLASSARKFLVIKKDIQPQHCPPMMSVGQVATITWLLKDQKLAPEKAGRELLANCYAAIRPDQQWFKDFREGMEKSGALSDDASNGNAVMLQAARRIAQEESFSEAAVVRELNMAEILQKAQKEIVRAEEQRNSEAEKEREELLEASQKVTRDAVEKAVQDVKSDLRMHRREVAERRAQKFVSILKILLFIVTIVALALVVLSQVFDKSSNEILWALVALAVVDFFALSDLLGYKFARKMVSHLTKKIADLLDKL